MDKLTPEQIKETTIVMFPSPGTVKMMTPAELKVLRAEVMKYLSLVEEELGI